MDFVFTETFYATYESLSDRDVTAIDKGIRRLMTANATGWARQGRIEGEKGSAWILTVVDRDLKASLYWEYQDADSIILLALVVRR